MEPIVKLTDIHKTYASGEVKVHAVRGISLDIHKGEFIAIMGASGSGKSTLMNTLGCLDRPTSGTYSLDGINVSSLGRNERADIRNQKIGFVFQGFNLLSRTTALENVELPMLYAPRRVSAKEMRDRAMHALEIVGLAKRYDHLPNQLSGGQQQRVAIARALVNNPQVILADEPTGNLDTKTSVEVMGVFQKLNDEGITIVMVTHELDIARYCKRNLIVRDGIVVRDAAVNDRSFAAEELLKVAEAEAAAKLTHALFPHANAED
ncbi:MAG: macrolide transporter ATP-binding protein [Rariglobus sp.]|jgi:putative ABC transport system ATP-binding protein|nr:macrolide transporter ATP-binding protein [Rariglobus sp.]